RAASRGRPQDPRLMRARLIAWTSLILLFAALGYASRFAGGTQTARDAVYEFSTFVGGVVQYAVWLGLVIGIASGRWDLFALRRPRSTSSAFGIALLVIVGILMVEAIVAQ